MESILDAYGSSSESSSNDAASASSDSEVECTLAANATQIGIKRKRSGEPQWQRAFPHVDGNWPSHVRLDIPVTHELREFARSAIEHVQKFVGDAVALVPFDELNLHEPLSEGVDNTLHMSLSRPFSLTYNQIGDFVDSLRTALKWRQRFKITLSHALVLVNDEKTRSFLALQVGEGKKQFTQVLCCVDQCLARFNLPAYYEDPIPHISIASSLGEELAQLTKGQCDRIFALIQETQQVAKAGSLTISVAAVQVAIGNKRYGIPLR